MAGITDLVRRASSSEGGRLLNVYTDLTEGTTWRRDFDQIVDDAGTAIDLSAATIVCKVVSTVVGATADAEVLTLTATGGVGTLSVSATSSETANLAVGASKSAPRKCWWYCTVTSGGSKVPFWGPSGSPFNIYAAG
jgi:hypothetical protein